ncbi:MAG: cobalamin-binding protein [Chloroflexi bacterium]|nr:cobalamin-binding protein [Chloroflexota bacterium]
MNRNLLKSLIALLIMVSPLALGACSAKGRTPGNLTDDFRRTVDISYVPQRIVSLAPSATEMLFSLGLGDRVVGVDKFSDYPAEATAKDKVGGFSEVDIEKVVSLRPDLVVAADIHKKEVIPALEKLGVKVIGLDAATLDGTLADIKLLGKVAGKEKEAQRLASGLESRIKAVAAKTQALSTSQRPRVLMVIWHDPIWTAGNSTLDNDLITRAGGTNIASDLNKYQTLALEKVIERDPEIVIVVTGHGDEKDTSFLWAKSEPRLANISARRNSPPKVFQANADITTRSTPRAIDGLETLAKLIHPELF